MTTEAARSTTASHFHFVKRARSSNDPTTNRMKHGRTNIWVRGLAGYQPSSSLANNRTQGANNISPVMFLVHAIRAAKAMHKTTAPVILGVSQTSGSPIQYARRAG